MGCDIVVAGASHSERLAIMRRLADRDRTFSRFRADSELNRVNAADGPVRVSQAFVEMLGVALEAERETTASSLPRSARSSRRRAMTRTSQRSRTMPAPRLRASDADPAACVSPDEPSRPSLPRVSNSI